MTDRYSIVAVADPVELRREEAMALLDCSASERPEEVIHDPRVDVVIVATPSSTHVPFGLAGLAAGKHVVVEKPMAARVREIDELAATAQANGRLVTCFHNNRFEGAWRVVKELMDSGRIGEPLLIRRAIHRYARRTDWQTLQAFGGGELSNQVSHYLDQLLAMFHDKPAELLAADLRHAISAGDTEDHAKIILRVTEGPLVEIEGSSSIALPQPGWFVAGTAGAITGSRKELTVRWLDPDQLPPIVADSGPAVDRRYGSTEEVSWYEETISVPEVDRTASFYDNLHEAMQGRAQLAITPESVRRQVKILERVRAMN